ncbi:SCO6745 family protein [Polymorphospora rubra]|uniref:SCO6745 family protein n=1 Tax=Polymorphospora rubra TaxID=338584 RepID=UPI003F4CD898
MDRVRRMWALFEPVHAVTYFAPQARARYEAAGLRGYWRGYFAGRAAAFGPVGPGPVHATFFGFHPAMVRRALPDVWSRATPADTLTARLDGARAALDDVLGSVPAADVAQAAELLRAAAERADLAGRALAAAHADLPWPDDPVGVLWRAATLLREHRGDGHVAVLVHAGLDGVESLVWRTAMGSDRQVLQSNRGWSDDEWDAAAARLVERGWLEPDGRPTVAALTARDDIERRTDELAVAPWRALGEPDTERLAALLHPITTAARVYLPPINPIGLPTPS